MPSGVQTRVADFVGFGALREVSPGVFDFPAVSESQEAPQDASETEQDAAAMPESIAVP